MVRQKEYGHSMAFTYTDDPANVPSDAVRMLVGDTVEADEKLSDASVAFFLAQTDDDVYLAATLAARAIGAFFATEVNTKFESVSSDYGQLSENYYKLATRLEAQAKKFGTKGLGIPAAGGLTYSDIDANDLNDDRVQPKFKQDQFANPPRNSDYDWRS